ncbi:Hypothetical protein CINCED_3A012870 [Cinara cedri]|uniref:Helitron helicase-like domain-containing protein n=1 Tax=Cinara cedri TaxID=506608 RepID=A0A5E4ME44_9HEMI|nr:Hypothetical protein CINCED_3A012870 [Cinara cedri]
MNKQCQHCHALKYKGESAGFCCASGKVILPPLNSSPEPLKALLTGATSQSKWFLRKIRKFNSCFQMTSFGATKIVQNEDGHNFQSTFKIQGQVYHQIGSLIPMSDSDSKCLQIYFMEPFLQNHNQLVQLFNTVSNRLQNDNYTIVVKADKVPSGQHVDRYNAQTINEVAVVIVGDAFERRDIRIKRRDNTVHTTKDSHRSYDALQYPLIFWEGEDRYHLNI